MPLVPGWRFETFEVVDAIGADGMGEISRACEEGWPMRDSRRGVGRTVACGMALLAIATAACQRAEPTPATPSRPPNVVVILVDDLRWDDIGAAGHPFVQTPAIDQLAREGTRFTNAFATTPLCSPSRAAILTGQYVHTNGIIDNTARDAASHKLETFAVPLQRAGYETAFFGKWHMGNDDTRRPGWSHWVAMKGQGEAIDPQLNVDGERVVVKGYVTDVLTDHTLRFIERAKERPFMVFLAHKALHPNVMQQNDGSVVQLQGQRAGFVPADRHRGRYASAVVPRRANATVAPQRKPALLRPVPGLPPLAPSTGTPDADVRDRLEMLLGVDESLARIVQALRDHGALDNTLLIFTSDHGYFYGEHGLNEERRLAYEETARIPLIVRFPAVARANVQEPRLTQIIDLAPTILALTGADDAVPRQGRSLVPLLRGEDVPWRSSVLIEYYSDTVFPRIVTMGYQAVRTERYKYIDYLELTGMNELYDLQADPHELDNLISTDAGRRLLPTLLAELARLQQESGYRAGFQGFK